MACKPDTGKPAPSLDANKNTEVNQEKIKLQQQPVKATLKKEKIDVKIEKPKQVEKKDIAKKDPPQKVKKNKPVGKLSEPIVKPKKSIVKKTATIAPAQPKSKPPVKNIPVIEFEELVYDFGELTEGDQISHKFKFKNAGKAPLSITAANATCGCTQPSFPFLDINPGETGIIGVEYFSVNKDGPQEPKITVLGNMEGGSVVLTLKGNVIPKKDKVKELQSASVTDTLLQKQ